MWQRPFLSLTDNLRGVGPARSPSQHPVPRWNWKLTNRKSIGRPCPRGHREGSSRRPRWAPEVGAWIRKSIHPSWGCLHPFSFWIPGGSGGAWKAPGSPTPPTPGRALLAFSPQEIRIPGSALHPLSPRAESKLLLHTLGVFFPPNSLWQSLWKPRTQLHFISWGYRMGGGEVGSTGTFLPSSFPFFWSSSPTGPGPGLVHKRLGCLSGCPS